MHTWHRHRWDVSAAEAIALQQSLRGEVIAVDQFSCIDQVAGVVRGQGGRIAGIVGLRVCAGQL